MDRRLIFIENFSPWGVVCPCPGAIYMYISIIITLEPEILYLAYLALEVTSPAIVGLNAFLASPNLP